MTSELKRPASFRRAPDERGHFGPYGGRFVAETLMPLILEVEKAYLEALFHEQAGDQIGRAHV